MASMPPGAKATMALPNGISDTRATSAENAPAMLSPTVMDTMESGRHRASIDHSMLRKRCPMKQPIMTKPNAETAGGTCPTTVPEPASRPLASMAPIRVGAVTRSRWRAAPPTRDASIRMAKASGVSRAGAELLFTTIIGSSAAMMLGSTMTRMKSRMICTTAIRATSAPLIRCDDQHRRQRARGGREECVARSPSTDRA